MTSSVYFRKYQRIMNVLSIEPTLIQKKSSSSNPAATKLKQELICKSRFLIYSLNQYPSGKEMKVLPTELSKTFYVVPFKAPTQCFVGQKKRKAKSSGF